MNCPYCSQEMKKGKASLITLQGFGNMMLSYTSEENANKGFFKKKTEDKIILFGDETETYYCPSCKKLIPIFDMYV